MPAGKKRELGLPFSGSSVLNRGSRASNIVHPVAEVANTPLTRPSTGKINNVHVIDDSTLSPQFYIVKVRALHAIDLFTPTNSCPHPVLPTINVEIHGSPMQECTAAQHARNHSIWKKHELKFRANCKHRDPTRYSAAGNENTSRTFISMSVYLTRSTCSCMSTKQNKSTKPIWIGEIGELQLPAKETGEYEVTRFFPVVRRQHSKYQSLSTLVTVGKVKLRIRVEVEKPAFVAAVVQPEVPRRPLFPLSTNFEEALQLKRKQLKATVVPESTNDSYPSQIDMDAAIELLKEIELETASDKIDAADLDVRGRVGEGIHSCVKLGLLYRKNSAEDRQVAVKEFRHQHAVAPVNVLRAFQQEYRILERCRSRDGLQHVVELLGVTIQPQLTLLMEFFNRGSLAQCLQDDNLWSLMSIKHKLAIGLLIARGILWLHENNVIHRDIKSHNILLCDDLMTATPTVKIGDLGSAVVHHKHDSPLMEEVGSSGYTAPEMFTHQGYGNKVDIWSFGIVLWELMSSRSRDRANPFMGVAGEEFVEKAQSGCRPQFNHLHQCHVGALLDRCWRFDPLQRPGMNEVVCELDKLCNE